MVFDFSCTVIAQSVLRLSLDHLVDEVGGLDGPASWDVSFLDLDLLRQDVVSDFLPGLAHVGSAAEHALVGHHAHSEVVDTSSVVDSAHHLRRHVAGCSRGVLSVLRPPDSGNTEVSNPEVALLINDQVLGLDVSVDDIFLVADLEAGNQARDPEL